MPGSRLVKALSVALIGAVACHETPPKPVATVPPPAVITPKPETAPSPASDSIPPDTITPASPENQVVTPDSALPPASYDDVPGWLVIGLRHPVWPEGAFVNGQRIEKPTVLVDSGIAVFPPNDRWKSVGRGTPLVYINGKGEKTELYPDGQSVEEPDADGMVVRVRAAKIPASLGWMVPRGLAGAVHALPIVDVTSPDGNSRTWSAGPFHVRAQRRSKLSAEIFAEANGISAKRKYTSGIDPQSDSSMGVDSDTLLDLKDRARMPDFLAAFEFAPGVAALIFGESGYECYNIRVLTFRPSKIEWQEKWYTGPCAH